MKFIDSFLIRFMNIFLRKNPYFTGVKEDTRTPEEQAKDYLHEERVMGVVPSDPFGNDQITTTPYPIENQGKTSSCVPHAIVLALAIERMNDIGSTFVRLSSMFLYRLRSNYPDEGCFTSDIFLKANKLGVPLATTLPDVDTEPKANGVVITPQMYTEAEIYKGLDFYMLKTPNSIDSIAAIAQQGHAVPIIIYATFDEWARQYVQIEYPSLKITDIAAEVHHEICVIPRSGFHLNGTRYVAIHDSEPWGGHSLRYVPEAFITARCTSAGYWDTVAVIGSGPRPHHVFTKTMKSGDKNEEVRQMQLLLISLGLLPSDCATGLFGGRTLAGVHAFQNMFASEILVPLGLNAPTDIFGSASIAKANKLCL